MEDIYTLNYDCIECMLNFEYSKYTYIFNLRSINKWFCSRSFQQMSSLCVEIDEYRNEIKQLIKFKYREHLTTLKIRRYPYSIVKSEEESFWKGLSKLKKLTLYVGNARSRKIYNHVIFTNLTYLKIKAPGSTGDFNLKYFYNLRYLRVHNMVLNCSTNYFSNLTNLVSLIRTMNDMKELCSVHLRYQYHSNLKYLKLNNIGDINLRNMTQLKTKIINDVVNEIE